MRVRVVENAFRYRIPLVKPLRVGSETLTEREGVLVRGTHALQWGEAAPLPGFSSETLEDVTALLDDEDSTTIPPSLGFALSSVSAFQDTEAEFDVPVNALLLGTGDDVLEQAKRVAFQDFACAKLKVGRGANLNDDVELVLAVRRLLRPEQQLRLDANRAWTLAEAQQFAEGVRGIDIEYIEEPTRCSADLEEFARASELAYALDETLLETNDLEPFPTASALVIKPTLLGSLRRIEQLALQGRKMVFSACIESGVGILNVARWAQHFSYGVPAGLDTYQWLASDVLVDRLDMSTGYLHVGKCDVNVSALEAIRR